MNPSATPTLSRHSPRPPLWVNGRFGSLAPFLVLIAVLLLLFLVLLTAGLDLGFIADILGFEYHFERLGVTGGLQFTLDHDRRHFLSGMFYAGLNLFFPGQSTAWYGSSILTHLANGVILMLLCDTLLRYRWRWLSLSAALIFVFDMRQIVEHYEIATGGHLKIGLGLALLALWLYILYVRGNRQRTVLRDLSIAVYTVAFMLYESTAAFFILHPLIAFLEDHPQGRAAWRRWIVQIIKDTLWYPLLFGAYALLLALILPPEKPRFFPAMIVPNTLAAFGNAFDPVGYFRIAQSTLMPPYLLLTGTVSAGVFAGLLLWSRHNIITGGQLQPSPALANAGTLVLFGLGMMLANILLVSPSEWRLPEAPRLVYPASAGLALFITGLFAALIVYLPSRSLTLRILPLTVVTALAAGTGVSGFFQTRSLYAEENTLRSNVVDAVMRAIPAWQGDTLPYMLLITDVDPDALALHAQDIRFPHLFDLMYNTNGILADAVYYDVPQTFPESARPAPDQPMSSYIGPYIVVEADAIYSPLRPGLPIPLERLVIVQYDSASNSASILPEIPPEVLQTGNIIMRADVQLRTNFALINSGD